MLPKVCNREVVAILLCVCNSWLKQTCSKVHTNHLDLLKMQILFLCLWAGGWDSILLAYPRLETTQVSLSLCVCLSPACLPIFLPVCLSVSLLHTHTHTHTQANTHTFFQYHYGKGVYHMPGIMISTLNTWFHLITLPPAKIAKNFQVRKWTFKKDKNFAKHHRVDR
jgi:hypothetical protein